MNPDLNLPNSLPHYLHQAFSDPKVVIYTEEMAFRRLENILLAAMHSPSIESRVYAFISRYISDLSMVAFRSDDSNATLEAYNQAQYHLGKTSYRSPDCAIILFDPATMNFIPVLSVEGKPLDLRAGEDWRDVEFAPDDALSIFQEYIPQLREQAQHAFANFDFDKHYIMLHVGNFFSLLLFDRGDEKAVQMIEQSSYEKTPVRSTKRQRRDSTGESLEPVLVQLDRPTVIVSEDQLPSELLPQVIYINQRILVERAEAGPKYKFNDSFLHALHLSAIQNGFQLQPSWLSLPPEFKAKSLVPDVHTLRILRRAYSRELANNQDLRNSEKLIELQQTPQDNTDSSYIPPRYLGSLVGHRVSTRSMYSSADPDSQPESPTPSARRGGG